MEARPEWEQNLRLEEAFLELYPNYRRTRDSCFHLHSHLESDLVTVPLCGYRLRKLYYIHDFECAFIGLTRVTPLARSLCICVTFSHQPKT